MIAVDDIGRCAHAIFRAGPTWIGKTLGIAGEHLTGAQMAAALATGYATAGTDTGHTGGNAAFAVGHPEKVIDMGYRAVHEMTAQAKALIMKAREHWFTT